MFHLHLKAHILLSLFVLKTKIIAKLQNIYKRGSGLPFYSYLFVFCGFILMSFEQVFCSLFHFDTFFVSLSCFKLNSTKIMLKLTSSQLFGLSHKLAYAFLTPLFPSITHLFCCHTSTFPTSGCPVLLFHLAQCRLLLGSICSVSLLG